MCHVIKRKKKDSFTNRVIQVETYVCAQLIAWSWNEERCFDTRSVGNVFKKAEVKFRQGDLYGDFRGKEIPLAFPRHIVFKGAACPKTFSILTRIPTNSKPPLTLWLQALFFFFDIVCHHVSYITLFSEFPLLFFLIIMSKYTLY